ncbi:hypothetical protein EGJ22_09930 [Pseudomonas sp. p99-361]|nr:hypothetical protein A3K88_10695 [Pseudomonas putida]PPB16221.1 hypothetical protein HV87_16635 [Pseudomonas aeruginosa]QEQ87622.1 hypothetical protein F1602_09920 [Pseudomonas putida]RRV19622.1 hypothetical protein EGJ22_09930 [Pseudomonas sp. p99-361]
MKRTALGMAEAGESLLKQTLQAIRAHQQAVDDARPVDEMERLEQVFLSQQSAWLQSYTRQRH